MNVKTKLFCLCGLLAITILGGCSSDKEPVIGAGRTANIQPANIRIDFGARDIAAARVSGDAGVAGRLVRSDDPVRVASISKMVTSIAVMRLAEQGRLDLDVDVSVYLGWPVRNPAFPKDKVTLRLLMAHLSSLTDNADYILPLDGNLQTALANPAAWDNQHAPGAYFQYANFNFPIIAAVMEAVTKERFDKLIARLVMEPLGIDACFNWSAGCSKGRRMRAVTLLRPNGELAKDGPFLLEASTCNFVPATDGRCDIGLYRLGQNGSAFGPQGGLRISAIDLVKIGQVFLNQGRPLLSQASVSEMTAPAWRKNGDNGNDEEGFFQAYGLGIHILKLSDGSIWTGHAGDAYGLRAGIWTNGRTGKGHMRYVTMAEELATVGHCFERCP
jgi:CubicO group peptidase (beta-lactamase class C family)